MAHNVLLVSSRFFSRTSFKNAINNVVVVGGGAMGSGIALVAAQAGNTVTIIETNPDLVKKSEKLIEGSLQRIAKKLHKEDPSGAESFVKGAISRLNGSTRLEDAAKGDLVIEAITENLEIKRELFKKLDEITPKNTILASNTSSLSITKLAEATKRADRFAGLHFFNPVPIMRLLEVVKTPELSEQVYQELMVWGKSIGKSCITCKDTPGFVVNRLLVPTMNEAFKMLEREDASARDIDTAMKLGAGYPMGPFELADYTGIDIGLAVLEGWHKDYPDVELFRPSELQRKLVREGKIGIKAGEGVYSYKK